MALFHFLWLSNIPFILWYVDSWFRPYRCHRQTCYHEHPLMVRAKPRFPGRNLPDGLGLLEEFIWHGALPGHLNRTSHCPLNLPRRTAPNGPLPSSFNTVVSSLCSSQIPNNARQEHFRLRIEDFGAKSLTSDFLSNENLTLTRWSTAQLFFKLLIQKENPCFKKTEGGFDKAFNEN